MANDRPTDPIADARVPSSGIWGEQQQEQEADASADEGYKPLIRSVLLMRSSTRKEPGIVWAWCPSSRVGIFVC